MRPTLLALDFKQRRAVRYQPKLGSQRPATFITQEAKIYQLDGLWMLGNEDGLAILEDFRLGKVDAKPIEDNEKECA